MYDSSVTSLLPLCILFISLDAPLVSIANVSPYETDVGGVAVLYCTARGNPVPKVQWYKDDTAVNPIPSAFQQSLVVQTSMPHTTVYTCKAINYAGNIKHTTYTNITVIVKRKQILNIYT